mgnify:CR=1 FL=1
MTHTYTKDSIPYLQNKLVWAKFYAKRSESDNFYRDRYSNPYERDVYRITKLIKLIETGVKVQGYEKGQVLINDKFVVTLFNNNWRILHRNKWYRHKPNVQHFIDNYVLKDEKN